MFTIIIHEKGGAERNETFYNNEITIGRVRGNDLPLPNGNVSKHHARLLLRDGRFILTDLKSTNGTYVNRRKIVQATTVNEGDEIHIGDYVLRLTTKAQPEAIGRPPAPIRPPARELAPAPPPAAVVPPPLLRPIAPAATAMVASAVAAPMPPPVVALAPPPHPPELQSVSHCPPDPDDPDSAPKVRDASGPNVAGATSSRRVATPAAEAPAARTVVPMHASIDAMVQAGGRSLLEACVAVRANVLVVGAGAGVVSAMLGALASCAPAGERLVVARDADEIAIAQGQVIPLHLTDDGARAEKVVQAAARLGADRLVIASLGGAVAAATIDAIAEGCEGVLAGLGATSLRHALARLVSEVALAKPGASLAAVREVVGESFDVAVEVAHGADGRPRVLRIAELAGSDAKEIVARDLFVLSAEGAGIVTAATPRLVGDFAARGVKLEAAAPSLRDGPHPGRTSLGRRTRAAPGARQP